MKVNLTRTDDVHPQLMDEIIEILDSVSGPLEFIKLETDWNSKSMISYEESVMFDEVINHKNRSFISENTYPTHFEELIDNCKFTREQYGLEDNEFVILITNQRNSINFFSVFDFDGYRNAFIQASDWDLFTDSPASYPVAYEVIANVLRILMKIKINDNYPKFYHYEAIGCMNDFCQNKKQIILKLRTADICRDCLSQLENENVDSAVITQAIGLFEKISTSFKFVQGFISNLKPKKVKVQNDGSILIGEKPIHLNPLQKTIFIFFLKHTEGIRLVELGDYEPEIFSIYQKIKGNADPDNISNLVSNIDGSFAYNKSRLTRKLKEEIGEPLANYYYISGMPGENFSISLDKNLIEIDPEFN